MPFDPLDPNTWNAPIEALDEQPQPTVPMWIRDEWEEFHAQTTRYVAICKELDQQRLSRKVDALVTEIDQLWNDSVSAAECRIIRMVGQVCVQTGHPELFRLIFQLALQGTPACGDVLDWLDRVTKSGPAPV